MSVLPWLGWIWLLVVGAEGIYLTADFFFGPWLPPATVLSPPAGDVAESTGGLSNVDGSAALGLIIALVVANSLFIAALRQFGDDKPAITKFALFLAAAFVLTGAFIAVFEARPILASLMLVTAWAGIFITYAGFGIAVVGRGLWFLWHRVLP